MKLFVVGSLLGMAVGSWFYSKLSDEFWTVLTSSIPRVISHVIPMEDEDDKESIVEVSRDALTPHFLTKIESFSLFSFYGIHKYETAEFTSGDCKWRLIIYPCTKEKDNNYLSVYLAMAETSLLPRDWEVNVIFTIFLYNQILNKYHCFRVKRGCCFNETKSQWGFSKFISEKSLSNKSSGYLVDNNLVVGAEVFVLNKQPVVERVTLINPPSTYMRNWSLDFSILEDIWTSKQFHASGFNWLCPKGALSSKDSVVPIYLVCVSADTFASHQKVKARFRMHLKGRSNADSGNLSHWFTSSKTSWGFSFMNIANFLIDGCCTVGVEISVQVIV